VIKSGRTDSCGGGGEILLSVIHKLINSIGNQEELPDQWKESIIVPIHKKGDKTVSILGVCILLLV
jgi:hypothetical protein